MLKISGSIWVRSLGNRLHHIQYQQEGRLILGLFNKAFPTAVTLGLGKASNLHELGNPATSLELDSGLRLQHILITPLDTTTVLSN